MSDPSGPQTKPEKKQKALEPLDTVIKRLNIGGYRRHILFCGGPTCCDVGAGQALWDHLKVRTTELGLRNHSVYVSRVSCLRVCQGGAIAVVYPEGVWYHRLDLAALDRVIDEHLVAGRPVQDLIMARNPLPPSEV